MAEDMYYEEMEDPFDADMEALLEMENEQRKAQHSPSPYAVKKLSFDDAQSPPAKKQRMEVVEGPAPVALDFDNGPAPSILTPTKKMPGVSHEMPTGDFMCVWNDEGSYVYVTVDRPNEDEEVLPVRRKGQHYLKTPISELQAMVESMQLKKLKEYATEQQGIQELPSKPLAETMDDMQLWVSKYAPNKFHELLSDNEVNLEVLQWLKEWDSCVFSNETEKRPWDKIILLTGGPGVGKTTLAHVLAYHAGYFPLEVNASMDRTEKELKEHFLSATGQQTTIASLKNKERRPICLILDEIDGVCTSRDQQSALRTLVKMAQVQIGRKGASGGSGDAFDKGDEDGEEDDDQPAVKAKKGAKKKGLPPILRPVICICNNPYAPALRELKAVAKMFTVPEVTIKRMASRLEHICRMEGLRHDRHALTDLCQLADGDIRSCLMTLQFLKTSQKFVTSQNITDSNVGIKDQKQGLFPIWTDIFYRNDKNKYVKMLGKGKSSKEDWSNTAIARWKCDLGYVHNLRQLEDHPDQEKLWEGCFEHYLKIKYSDLDGAKTFACIDWFAWVDRCLQLAMKSQTFALRRFVPFGIAQTHLHCSSTRRPPRLEFPRTFQTHRTMHEAHAGILRTLMSGLPIPLRPFTLPRSLSIDVLSFLMRILTPKLKVSLSNLQLLSAKDKADLKDLTLKYVQYNITYIAHTEGPQTNWILDIELDKLVNFTGLPSTITPLPTAVRQVLSREINFEKVRQASAQASAQSEAQKARSTADEMRDKARAKEAEALRMKSENERKIDLQLANKKKKPLAAKRDFFGRVVAPDTEQFDKLQKKSSSPAKLHCVRFQYNEGFTNAIRRPVRLEDFL